MLGIYQHFEGKLYFVLGEVHNKNSPTDCSCVLVMYHPLYHCENMQWRWSRVEEFNQIVERGEYCGPQFVHLCNWELPNILPGCIWLDPRKKIGNGHGTWVTIKEVRQDPCRVLVADTQTGPVMSTIALSDLRLFHLYSHKAP